MKAKSKFAKITERALEEAVARIKTLINSCAKDVSRHAPAEVRKAKVLTAVEQLTLNVLKMMAEIKKRGV